MTDQTSNKNIKLAGFVFERERRATYVFARFCRPEQDPENLPATEYHPVLQKQWPARYPQVSSADIAAIITGEADTLHRGTISGQLSRVYNHGELAAILTMMQEARARHLQTGEAYIPACTL